MKIIYTPSDGERQEFIFRPGELTNVEAEMIEIQGGEAWDTYEEFGRKFMNGNMRAYRAALWICLKRHQDPKIKFMDVSFRVDQIDVDLEEDEKERIYTAIESDENIDPEQRELMLEMLGEGGQDQKVIKELDQFPGPDFIEGAVAEPVGKDDESVSATSST